MVIAPARFGGSFTTGEAFLEIAGSSTYTVPAGFNPSNNTVELIGAGGRGNAPLGNTPGNGGGGGQYAKYTNLSLTPGATINYQVGSATGAQGTSASPGTADTWLSVSTAAYAQGGQTQSTTSLNAAGGNAAAVNGATIRNGGIGLGTDNSGWAGSGGGGSGGPAGVGANGGGENTTSGGAGGAGGSADGGAVAGGTGVAGAVGNNGATEALWSNGKGPGSGGAGGSNNKNGGNGAGYGGGGGGGGWSTSSGGTGSAGVIRIAWAP